MKKSVTTGMSRNVTQNALQNDMWRAKIPILLLVLIFCILLLGCGCSNLADGSSGALSFKKADKNELSIVSWNLQTFFDALDTGTEYEEFTGKKSKWTEEKYKDRIEKLCIFMKAMNADIFCFMEVENTAVVQDIANTLQIGISGMEWPYVCFAREEGACLGCAVFSRYKPESFTTHITNCKVAVQTEAFSGFSAGELLVKPAMRPLMEIRFSFSSKQAVKASQNAENAGAGGDSATGDRKLALFVVHWKSKSGGAKESEVWRNCQEAVLAGRIESALADGCSVVACGDFNKELSEFKYSKMTGYVDLKGSFSTVTVKSPWFSSKEEGSYFYNEAWNRIDHFFLAGGSQLISFKVVTMGEHVTSGGLPYCYDVWSGRGYSDHLPLLCRLML